MTTPLDSFETALLADLRAIVSARGAEPIPTPRRPRRRRRWVVTAVGVAAATVSALALFPGIGAEPAFAVSVDGNGEVHVRVHQLKDAAGLGSALQAQGITADVQYLPDHTECAPGCYQDAPSHPGDFNFTVGDGFGYNINLAPGVIRNDETLVIAASRLSPTGDPGGDGISDEGGTWASIGVASGPVSPCVPLKDQ